MTATEAIADLAGVCDTVSDPPEHPNRELIDGLRQLATWLETHPQSGYAPMNLDLFPTSKADLLRCIRGAGRLEKRVTSNYAYLRAQFGPNVSIEWNRPREEVCERKVVGVRMVEKPIVKQVGVETVEEEIVEWDCQSILATAAADQEEVTARATS